MAVIDPITREIVRNALASAADEMAMALYRTAYSTIVRDCLDYSTSLCDAEGQMIAQGVTIPLHLGSVPFAMETLLAKYGDDIEEGDVFILNDPFEGGMHIPDIFIVQPVFWEGQRVAFAVSTAHHLDLGGRLPGSSACDNTEIFQEGLRIPWLKLYRQGEADEALFALIRANVRVPQMTIGDLRAQLAACHIGARAIGELIGRYGPDTFARCTADLIDYTERLVRAEIASWPDGSHTFADYMDSDGVGGPPVRLQVEITVAGDELRADFTGTDPQVSGAINNTLSFTSSVVALCVRSVLREDIPNTAGMFRPLEIVAPPGTVVNGVMPAASSMRGITGFRLADTIFGALAGLLPDRVMAAGEGGNTLVIIGGQRPDRQPYVYYELLSGTWGGRPDRDGNDGLCNPANVASNIPVEQAESEYPVRVERYGLVNDSGGAGRFRGGLAIERSWRLLDGQAHLAIRSDRRDHLPYGLYGGGSGTASINTLYRNGEAETLPTMISTTMAAGEVIYHRQAGGGGWGDPLERDPEAVARGRGQRQGFARRGPGPVRGGARRVPNRGPRGYGRPAGTAGSREHMSPAPADLLIRGGTVIDGTGKAPLSADVAIKDGRIAYVEPRWPGTADRVLEAAGLWVAPGFIDIHSHSDFTLLADPRAMSSIAQGVTLEVVGNCGHGCAPLTDPTTARMNVYGYAADYPIDWRSVGQYLERLQERQPAVNVLTLVPNGRLRLAVAGLVDRPSTPDELRRMKELLQASLEEGAFGFSTGLEYGPERACSEEEIAELCGVVAECGGLYATHTRNRAGEDQETIAEAIRTAQTAGVALQISHISVVARLAADGVRAVDGALRAGGPGAAGRAGRGLRYAHAVVRHHESERGTAARGAGGRPSRSGGAAARSRGAAKSGDVPQYCSGTGPGRLAADSPVAVRAPSRAGRTEYSRYRPGYGTGAHRPYLRVVAGGAGPGPRADDLSLFATGKTRRAGCSPTRAAWSARTLRPCAPTVRYRGLSSTGPILGRAGFSGILCAIRVFCPRRQPSTASPGCRPIAWV